MAERQTLQKRQAREAFSRAAGSYDRVAVLQREIGRRMRERLDYIRLQPQVVLDAGAGTGVDAVALARRFRKARVIALDFAMPMLQLARRRGSWWRRRSCLCADLEHLPLADHSVDLLYSNAALQWSPDLAATFREFRRVLRPGGLSMFTTFGPDTLRELRSAWSQVDENSHVNRFYDLHDIGDLLLAAGFSDPVVDVEWLTLTYSTVDALMRDLKSLGAHNASGDRPRSLTGKGRLRAMRQAYETFRADGRLPATYEVVYGHAWAPEQWRSDGEVRVPLSSIERAPPK